MIVHNVLFWLKPTLSEADKEDFGRQLQGLSKVPSVNQLYVGSPAPINRPVVDTTYSFCLTVIFEGMPAHDAYQIDPIHKEFLANNKEKWDRVQIYDSLVPKN